MSPRGYQAAALALPLLISCGLFAALSTPPRSVDDPNIEFCARSDTLLVGSSLVGNFNEAMLSRQLRHEVVALALPNLGAPGWYATLSRCYARGNGPQNILIVGLSASMLSTEPASNQELSGLLSTSEWRDIPGLHREVFGPIPAAEPLIQVQVQLRNHWQRSQLNLFEGLTLAWMSLAGSHPRGQDAFEDMPRDVFRAARMRDAGAIDGFVTAKNANTSGLRSLPPEQGFTAALIDLAQAHQARIGFVLMPHRNPNFEDHDAANALIQYLRSRGADIYEQRSPALRFRQFQDKVHVTPAGRTMLTKRLIAQLTADQWRGDEEQTAQ